MRSTFSRNFGAHFLTFGQTNETSSSTEQTFASGNDTFVSSEPTGYGIYEERESNIFAPGETFLLYVEPVGYSYGNMTGENGERLYTMNFTVGFTISTPNGTVLAGQETSLEQLGVASSK